MEKTNIQQNEFKKIKIEDIRHEIELQKNDASSQKKSAYNTVLRLFALFAELKDINPREVENLRPVKKSVKYLKESIDDKYTIISQSSDGLLTQNKRKQNQKRLTEIGGKVKDLGKIKEEIKSLLDSKEKEREQQINVFRYIHKNRYTMLCGDRFPQRDAQQIETFRHLSFEDYQKQLRVDNKKIEKIAIFQKIIDDSLGYLQQECKDIEEELTRYNQSKTERPSQEGVQTDLSGGAFAELSGLSLHFQKFLAISDQFIPLLQTYQEHLQAVPKLANEHINRVLFTEQAEERLGKLLEQTQKQFNPCKHLIALYNQKLKFATIQNLVIANDRLTKQFDTKITLDQANWKEMKREQVIKNDINNNLFLNPNEIENISKDFRESVQDLKLDLVSPLKELQEEWNLVGPYEHISAHEHFMDLFPAFCQTLYDFEEYNRDLINSRPSATGEVNLSTEKRQELLEKMGKFIFMLEELHQYAFSMNHSNRLVKQQMTQDGNISDFPEYTSIWVKHEIVLESCLDQSNEYFDQLQTDPENHNLLSLEAYNAKLIPFLEYCSFYSLMNEYIEEEINASLPFKKNLLWPQSQDRKKAREGNPLGSDLSILSSVIEGYIENWELNDF